MIDISAICTHPSHGRHWKPPLVPWSRRLPGLREDAILAHSITFYYLIGLTNYYPTIKERVICRGSPSVITVGSIRRTIWAIRRLRSYILLSLVNNRLIQTPCNMSLPSSWDLRLLAAWFLWPGMCACLGLYTTYYRSLRLIRVGRGIWKASGLRSRQVIWRLD
jgi:hypothetical protein